MPVFPPCCVLVPIREQLVGVFKPRRFASASAASHLACAFAGGSSETCTAGESLAGNDSCNDSSTLSSRRVVGKSPPTAHELRIPASRP